MKKWIIIAVALLVASVVAVYFKAKKWMSEINYGFAEGFKYNGLVNKSIELIVPIWIYNPTPVSVVFSDLDLKVFMNGVHVSNIQSSSNYKIASKRNSTYPLTVKVDPKALINLLAEQGAVIDQQDWMKKVMIRVEGTITADVGIFKLKNYHIEMNDSLKSYMG